MHRAHEACWHFHLVWFKVMMTLAIVTSVLPLIHMKVIPCSQ